MKKHYDVVIIGGAVIGASVAYYLAVNPDFNGSILVLEKDPSYRQASTALSASSIRTQFSNAINVKISQYGYEIISRFGEIMAVNDDKPSLDFHPGGYLFLANDAAKAQTLNENHRVQRALGADVVLWDKAQLKEAFPHLNVDDVELASYGQKGEGWFNNTGLMNGFKKKAQSLGATFIADEVVGLKKVGTIVREVMLQSGGTVNTDTVVNASGPRAASTARMAGLDIPIEARKRTNFVFKCSQSPEGTATINEGRLPLMIDPTGVFCRPEGATFLTGCTPCEDPAVDYDDFEPRYSEFEDIIWPALAARSANFEAIRVVNQWAGHYAFNTLDHNLVVGRHPEISNFIFANGFSGHGLQQAPATGRGVSELIVYNEYRTLDLTEVGFERIVENRPFLEKAVI